MNIFNVSWVSKTNEYTSQDFNTLYEAQNHVEELAKLGLIGSIEIEYILAVEDTSF